MFRTMRRFKQQLENEECISILKNEKRGVLSLIGDDGYPYGIPLSHMYSEKDGKIYFHGAKEGHKIDAIKNCDKASFCVYDKGYTNPGEWALNVKSVVVFGRVKLIDDIKRAEEICSDLVRKFTSDEEYLKKELANALSRVQCFELEIEHMTGKRVKEE
ncbi:pyridoxamine 5'-phosphate oxidase family protein [Treponema sp.]|uniref:pyridoxamine 5'-phosphate oxidase family protein n=1 Tax=Treponema sp. TaxID=166 RepID=UPI0025FCE646|nr:pyridoxamine 5'-phosphate oxidase family protein [Treponema sp.]MCR5218707.1 pyridoxamine 5'-phosphate oxidase family protein [Treponema sp.]